MKKLIKYKEYAFLILFAILVLMLNYKFITNHVRLADLTFHTNRMIGLSESLANSDLFPKLDFRALDGFGYANPIFYSNWYLYPFSIMYLTVRNVEVVMLSLILFYNLVFSFLTYRILLKKTNHKLKSLFLTSVFIYAPYKICITEFQFRLGEFMAYYLTIFVLYYYFETIKNKQNWWKLTLSMSMLLITHNISGLITTTVLLVLFLIHLIQRKITLNLFWYLALAGIFTIGLSLFYYLPIIEQSMFQSISFSTSNPFRLDTNKMSVPKYLGNLFFFSTVTPTLNIFITGLFLSYLLKKGKWDYKLTIIVTFVFMLSLNIFPFFSETFINNIQFYHRYTGIIQALVVLLVADYDLEENKKSNIQYACLTASYFMLLSFLSPIFLREFQRTSVLNMIDAKIIDMNNLELYSYDIGYGQEYLPTALNNTEFYLKNPEDYTFVRNYNKVIIDTNESETITLPVTAYKGYKAYSNGVEQEMKLKEGLFRLDVKYSEQYVIKYERTFVQNLSLAISVLFLLGLIGMKKEQLQE